MKIERLISIIMILLQTDRISMTTLADKFRVSRRTIYRDIESLSSAGIPVVTFNGSNGGVGLMPEYKINKTYFTNEEIASLLSGLQSVSSIHDINSVQSKLKTLIPINNNTNSFNCISIDINAWGHNPAIIKKFNTIKEAIQKIQLISFKYKDMKGVESQRTVEPYRLMLKENLWYLQSFCLDKNSERLFRLSRMWDIHAGDIFYPRVIDTSIDLPTRGLFEVKVIIEPFLKDEFLNYGKEEDFILLSDGRYKATVFFLECDMAYGALMCYGKSCECIYPENVRKELQRRTYELYSIYKQD